MWCRYLYCPVSSCLGGPIKRRYIFVGLVSVFEHFSCRMFVLFHSISLLVYFLPCDCSVKNAPQMLRPEVKETSLSSSFKRKSQAQPELLSGHKSSGTLREECTINCGERNKGIICLTA